jgi:DNA invertase Pin-like site-specific DNA recombinase
MPSKRRLAQYLSPPSQREKAALASAAAPTAGKVYGYCRVSTVAQADEGESLDVQQRTLRGYCDMHGLTLDQIFVERGISASKPLGERPEGAKLLAALKLGDVVIAPKLDRLFRSAIDALQVATKMRTDGISLHLLDLGGNVSTDGMARTFFIIASAFAEAERDRTRERITEVKRDQRQRGRYLGGKLPFGWRVGEEGALVEVPAQQAAIGRMQRMRAQGMALRAIAERMNKDGHELSHQGVKKVLAAAERRGGKHSRAAQSGGSA